jgi:hypothetical protein
MRRLLHALLCLFLPVPAALAADARPVTLTFPEGYIVQQGAAVTYSAPTVDAIVRTQSPDYLMSVARSLLPAPADFTVGKITGGPGPSAIPVYIAGRVVETACKVELRVNDRLPYYAIVPTVTVAGFPKTWRWEVPAEYHDGRTHKVYARALRCTGTVIGPLDNAKAAAQWPFTIGNAPPPTPPPPAPPPAFTAGRVSYAPGSITVEAVPRFTKVEVLIDSRTVAPWYLGTRTFVNGVAVFPVPAAARDGAEHLLDVRLYEPAMDAVFRPDGYPTRATLTP